MADIFLSYARGDFAKAQQLAAALEKQGWSVYCDSALLAGQKFHDVIEKEIDDARCLIVAWSRLSVKSDWVQGEAESGKTQNKLVAHQTCFDK